MFTALILVIAFGFYLATIFSLVISIAEGYALTAWQGIGLTVSTIVMVTILEGIV